MVSKKLTKLLDQAREHLDQGEQVEAAVLGNYETTIGGTQTVRAGILLATDRRIVFFAKRLTGHELESFPYGNVSSFEAGKAMLGYWFRFFAAGNRVHLKWIQDGDIDKFTRLVRERAGQQPVQQYGPPQQQQQAADPMAVLQQLGEMAQRGLINEQEYARKRAEVLARM